MSQKRKIANKPKKQQARKPRAPAPRRAPAGSNVRTLVRSMIAAERSAMDITEHGARYISMVTDLMSQDGVVTPLERQPVGGQEGTYLLSFSGKTTFSGATATSGFICLVGQAVAVTTQDQAMLITYGADATNMGATMTTTAEAFDDEYATGGTLSTQYQDKKVVAAMIRITPVQLDTADGYLTPYLTAKMPCYSGAGPARAYSPNSDVYAGLKAPSYNVKQGCCVRRGAPEDGVWCKGPTLNWQQADNSNNNIFGAMPCIRFHGLSASTVLDISWRYVIESKVAAQTPMPVEKPYSEPEYERIAQTINEKIPWHATGNSFSSFMRRVWNGVRGGVSNYGASKTHMLSDAFAGFIRGINADPNKPYGSLGDIASGLKESVDLGIRLVS